MLKTKLNVAGVVSAFLIGASGFAAIQEKPTNQSSTAREIQVVEKNSYDKHFGVNLGFQIPTGPFLEANFRPNRHLSLGLSGGGITISGLFSDSYTDRTNSFSTLAFESKVRWHVIQDAFFLGVAAGWQRFTIASETSRSADSAFFQRFYLTPQLGWIWVFDSGFTMGTDFGLQIPVSTARVEHNGRNQSADRDVKTLSEIFLPYITFLKLGYSF